MPAETFQNLNIDPGFVSGPGRVAPLEAQALQQRGAALEQIGGALGGFAQQLQHAQNVTRLNDATTKALVGFNDLETKFARDPDFQTAPQRFQADAEKLTGELVDKSGLSGEFAAKLREHVTRLQISTLGGVQRKSFNAETAQNVANLGQAAIGLQTRYLAAGSDTERQAVLDQHQQLVAGTISGGFINAAQGQQEVANFRSNAQTAEAVRLIGSDARGATAALSDPQRFANIDPVRRANLLEQAKATQDTQGLLQVGNLALRAPERAAAEVGKASDPQTVAAIFDKGVIPQESGGRADAISPKGALGIAQLIPDTARAAASRAGLPEIAALSDAALSDRLLKDPALNRRLGLNEFSHLIDRYDGDIPAALAGYNAGPGRADAWRAKAIEQFGPNYTPEQFASVIPIQETRDYVSQVYARLGARGDAFGLSENARLRAQTSVASAIAGEDAQRRAGYARMAADAAANDPVTDSLKGGEYVDPGRLTAYRQVQSQAAAAGDPAAAQRLRQLDFAEEAAPVMAQAFRMPPSELAATVNAEESRLANSGGTPAESRRLDTLKITLAAVSARARTDPIGLASRAGAFRVEPLPVNDPKSAQFGAALASRDGQAIAAAQLYNGNLVPLRPEEAAALKNSFNRAGPNDKIGLLAQFSAHLSEDVARKAVEQVAGDDSLAFTAGTIALRDPVVGKKILEGQTLLESPGVKPKVADVRAALEGVFKGQIYFSPRTQKDAIDAGLAVYAANRAQSGALFDASDRTGLETAIQEVTGNVVAINGARTPIPPGVKQGVVTTSLKNLSADDLAPFGGLQKGLDAEAVADNGQFHALDVGGTHYAVTFGGRAVMDASGTRPLIVELAQLAAQQQTRFAQVTAARIREPVRVPASQQEADLGLPLLDKGVLKP